MLLPNSIKIFFLYCFLVLSLITNAQKDTIATYEGGHGCVYKTLLIFSDSTFFYKECTALFIPSCRKKKGVFLFGDSSITLYTKKRFHAFIAKPENKYSEDSYRVRGTSIMMYTEADEKSANGNFLKAYNTLKKV